LKNSEEAEVCEEEKKTRMMMKMMMGRRWRENFKPDARKMNGAGS
jgi:hypothetical protein